ncbi:hypothetical protein F3Y22_tig00110187pilonHSYRG00285 [Hibiscus syriacus]|uniref:Uncharacterized protein n=1 Tax=Hibiscus syriacus TaxID=106335 RepID=A0A6A3BFS8_HIBSY|nr:hypothetical protein F3Y22_tig00110187pilonHSYRG00285 [Hibiscus syriacus]
MLAQFLVPKRYGLGKEIPRHCAVGQMRMVSFVKGMARILIWWTLIGSTLCLWWNYVILSKLMGRLGQLGMTQVGPNTPLDGSNSKAFDDSIRSVDYFKHVDLSISKLLLENHVVNAFEGHYSPCDNPVFKGNSKVVEDLKNMHVGSVVALDVAHVENAVEGSFTPLDSSSNKGFVVGSNVELVSSRNVDEGTLSKSLVGCGSEESLILPCRSFTKKLKLKKFGSMLEIQGKILSKAEKRRRDRALKKLNLNQSDLLSDLSGTSISDYVLRQRWLEAFIEAQEAMSVDRQLGLMVGSPEMVGL